MKLSQKSLLLISYLYLLESCHLILSFQVQHSFRAPSTPTQLCSSSLSSLRISSSSVTTTSSKPPIRPFMTSTIIKSKSQVDDENDDDDDDDDDDAWDSPEDYNDDIDDDSFTTPKSFGNQPSLGINIGSQLEPLTPEQAQSLKSEATQKINAAFDERIQEIANMKESIQKDFERSKQNLQYASELRAQQETEKLMNKIDKMSNDFLQENEELRMGTKFSAKADRNNAMEGKGLEVGSWGSVGGRDVGMGMGLMNSSEDGEGTLLGSIGSMRSNSPRSSSIDEDDDEMEEEIKIVENRIMVIIDDKQVR